MQRYDVALWLTPFSWWPDQPDHVAFVHTDAALAGGRIADGYQWSLVGLQGNGHC